MKKLIISLLFLLVMLGSIVYGLMVAPYVLYDRLLKNDWKNDWYHLEDLKPLYFAPKKKIELEPFEERNENLYWFKFHLLDVLIPIPIRHPLYRVVPIPHFVSKEKPSEIGLKFLSPNKRELLRIYFLQNVMFSSNLDRQPLFKLPLVKHHLMKIPVDTIWKDLFSKSLKEVHIPVGEMIYNLYLMQLRASILPKTTVDYGLVDGGRIGIIELESQNKDYMTEYILTRDRGLIYSYLIITEKNNPESIKLRSRFLKSISFISSSPHLSKIIYQEFKALPYDQQIDHEGLMYLFSAWTHDMNEPNFIREMIQHLERGPDNADQLLPLYRYAFDRFGETFSLKDYPGIKDSDVMHLRRAIDREKFEKKQQELLPPPKPVVPERKLTPKEILEQKLKDAKKPKEKKAPSNKIILDN